MCREYIMGKLRHVNMYNDFIKTHFLLKFKLIRSYNAFMKMVLGACACVDLLKGVAHADAIAKNAS